MHIYICDHIHMYIHMYVFHQIGIILGDLCVHSSWVKLPLKSNHLFLSFYGDSF